ncbi:MAG: tRNA (cytidine(34)-2'-O)-methyltransferase [Alphaproteobacteria bacterium]|nr:tRNA (cytidine(34)-2'-O)-methyltransferase [Alphaproteobacteria bacterium]
MIRLALYQPDIPQNSGAAMRLCACVGAGLDIIEPCGFVWDDKKIKRSALDYTAGLTMTRHTSWDAFLAARSPQNRIILLTTKGDMPYTDFTFRPDDILMMGRESAGVPDDVHNRADARVIIPMRPGMRSLNVINAAAMVLGEALRQTGGFDDV